MGDIRRSKSALIQQNAIRTARRGPTSVTDGPAVGHTGASPWMGSDGFTVFTPWGKKMQPRHLGVNHRIGEFLPLQRSKREGIKSLDRQPLRRTVHGPNTKSSRKQGQTMNKNKEINKTDCPQLCVGHKSTDCGDYRDCEIRNPGAKQSRNKRIPEPMSLSLSGSRQLLCIGVPPSVTVGKAERLSAARLWELSARNSRKKKKGTEPKEFLVSKGDGGSRRGFQATCQGGLSVHIANLDIDRYILTAFCYFSSRASLKCVFPTSFPNWRQLSFRLARAKTWGQVSGRSGDLGKGVFMAACFQLKYKSLVLRATDLDDLNLHTHSFFNSKRSTEGISVLDSVPSSAQLSEHTQ